jgi:quercetin dioxygenase-like cupin family protein
MQGGEMILMPANQPHALKALKRYKIILTMLRS